MNADYPTPGLGGLEPVGQAEALERQRRQFAEDLSLIWEMAGTSRMDGRVLGYLMVTDQPCLSSAQLAQLLKVSAGAISMATRRLVDMRFIRRRSVAGDRSHYFSCEEDPWGSFLSHEHQFFDREIATIEAAIDAFGPGNEEARRRLVNGRDYLQWVALYHAKMLLDWKAHKLERDKADG